MYSQLSPCAQPTPTPHAPSSHLSFPAKACQKTAPSGLDSLYLESALRSLCLTDSEGFLLFSSAWSNMCCPPGECVCNTNGKQLVGWSRLQKKKKKKSSRRKCLSYSHTGSVCNCVRSQKDKKGEGQMTKTIYKLQEKTQWQCAVSSLEPRGFSALPLPCSPRCPHSQH